MDLNGNYRERGIEREREGDREKEEGHLQG